MKTIEEIRAAFHRIHRAACGDERSRGYMSIPADAERDADIIVAVALDELERLRAYVAGEPARLAAAREEQREMDVRSCPTCKGEGFTMRVRECPFCDDSTHDHECPTDEVKVYCLCGAARIRAAPLTATPLADQIDEAERDEREAT